MREGDQSSDRVFQKFDRVANERRSAANLISCLLSLAGQANGSGGP